MIPDRTFQRVLALIRKRGVTMTVATTKQVAQPSVPGRTAQDGETSETAVRGIMTTFDMEYIDGETIKITDRLILVAGKSLPEAILNGTITVKGQNAPWSIRGCQEVSPDGRPVLYKFHVRK